MKWPAEFLMLAISPERQNCNINSPLPMPWGGGGPASSVNGTYLIIPLACSEIPRSRFGFDQAGDSRRLGVYDLWEKSPVRWGEGECHAQEIIEVLFPATRCFASERQATHLELTLGRHGAAELTIAASSFRTRCWQRRGKPRMARRAHIP